MGCRTPLTVARSLTFCANEALKNLLRTWSSPVMSYTRTPQNKAHNFRNIGCSRNHILSRREPKFCTNEPLKTPMEKQRRKAIGKANALLLHNLGLATTCVSYSQCT